MNVRELLELAHLDCLGFLDEGEQAAFESAFRAAPDSVKAQIRAEQARWTGGAGMYQMLPNVEPSPGLRDRVLDSVSTAIFEADALKDHALMSGALADGMNAGMGGGVSKWWRAGSIGLLSACAVFGGAFLAVSRENSRLTRSIQNEQMLGGLASLRQNSPTDPSREILFSHALARTVLAAGVGESRGSAVWFSDPSWTSGRLVVEGLPRTGGSDEYAVVLIDSANQVNAELARFSFEGSRKTFEATKAAPGSRIAIVAVNKGVALTGTTLASTQLLLIGTLS